MFSVLKTRFNESQFLNTNCWTAFALFKVSVTLITVSCVIPSVPMYLLSGKKSFKVPIKSKPVFFGNSLIKPALASKGIFWILSPFLKVTIEFINGKPVAPSTTLASNIILYSFLLNE